MCTFTPRVPTSTTRRFEDGTPNFLGISALKFGFEALAGVGGPAAINKHTMAVTHYLLGLGTYVRVGTES